MKYKLTLALVALIIGTAFGSMPAVLPEFKNAKQLAEWRAEMSANSTPQTIVTEDNAFYTGRPYVESSGGYAFKYRSYNPELARWTSEDPSGFPDGANGSSYAPIPTSSIDPLGLLKLSLLGSLSANSKLDINNQIGTVNVVRYNKLVDTMTFGADMAIDTTIRSDNEMIYRWMQHITITDQDGNFLD